MSGWVTFGSTIRGAAHVKNDKPCQDALRIKDSGHYRVALIADGHGSEQCPHSDEGALAAVETAEEIFSYIMDADGVKNAFTTLESNKEIWLPKQLETGWKQRVQAIHAEKGRACAEGEPFPFYVYGTTLAGCIATDTFLFVTQIGDGDILIISGDAQARWLIPPDYGVGNETYSLCMDNSWRNFRAHAVKLTGNQPLMVLMSTDGYANSFSEQDGFLKAGNDIFNLWRENGVEYIQTHLTDWLKHSSYDGSGDDITMALLVRE